MGDKQVIWVRREWKYFLMEDWTTQIALTVLMFFVLNAHGPDAAFTGPFKTNSFIATSSAMQRQHCGQLGR